MREAPFDVSTVRGNGNSARQGASRDLSVSSDADMVGSVKNDDKVDVRLPSELRVALEQERKRMSKAAGAEVKTSAVIRALLEQALRGKRRTETAAAR